MRCASGWTEYGCSVLRRLAYCDTSLNVDSSVLVFTSLAILSFEDEPFPSVGGEVDLSYSTKRTRSRSSMKSQSNSMASRVQVV